MLRDSASASRHSALLSSGSPSPIKLSTFSEFPSLENVDTTMSRPRSVSSSSPPSSPASIEDTAFERPSTTPPRRHSLSNGPNSKVASGSDSSRNEADMRDGTPSSMASSADSRPRTPDPPKDAAVSSKSLVQRVVSDSKKACFQELIQPLVYYDVPHPSLLAGTAPSLSVHANEAAFPGSYLQQQQAFGHPIYTHTASYYDGSEYPYIQQPPTPPYSTNSFGQAHSVNPPSRFGLRTYTPSYDGTFGNVYCAANPYHPPFFPSPHDAFGSPPASPDLGDDGLIFYGRPRAQHGYYPALAPAPAFHPLPPPPSPFVPTLHDLLDQGEHFMSSGTCKFFDVARGFGFIIDDHGEDLGADVFVHYTGIDMTRGFRCLANDERVEYILTKHSSGRYQALRVSGENGKPLKGLSDERNADLERRLHIHSADTKVCKPIAVSAPAPVPVSASTQASASIRVKDPLPAAQNPSVQRRRGGWTAHGLRIEARSPLGPRSA